MTRAIELNPEFRRNLWLELTPQRLVAVPVVIALAAAVGWLSPGRTGAVGVAVFLLWGLLTVWGSRLAADVLVDEVAGHTWENQRMTALSPWAMTWGKLIGGTVVAWYGASWCVAVIAVAGAPPWGVVARPVLYGLLAQTLALLFSLLVLQLHDGAIRAHVSLAQLGALLLTFGVFEIASGGGALVTWYGLDLDRAGFGYASLAAAIAWATLGIWRLMRTEMQASSGPGCWFGFSLFAAVYAGGFSRIVDVPALILIEASEQRLVASVLVLLALTYVAAFLAPKRYAELRRVFELAWAGRWRAAWPLMPPWSGSLVLAVVLCIAFPATALGTARPFASTGSVALFLAACLLFTVRDLGLLLTLTLDADRGRGHVATLVYLGVLYGLLPALFGSMLGQDARSVLLPWPDDTPLLTLGAAALQAALALYLLRLRVARLRLAAG
ncbi:MAG TPA: hypothetical protein VMB81_06660 [Candidatus Sulfotelmatobacter sp.]|nr:hypothetical protein [Candidatus Sulfotelmatobacter sp.]